MKTVLIVEDDMLLSLLLAKQVKRLGYEVISRATSGASAINKVKDFNPDIIIMDIKLEGDLDGIDAMNSIRTFSDAAFFYITGNSDPETITRAMKTNPVVYLIKPIELNKLGEALTKASEHN
ncbi:MAG: response regulator [Balneolales bacterium]